MEFPGDRSLRDIVVESTGEEIFDCYQCYKCSAGCPVSYAMDLLPHQIIRSVLFNRAEKVLSSRTIWICAACETCSTRCPNKIDIARVMDVLRQMQRESKTEGGEPKVSAFHEAFLDSIKNKGRVHELTMIGNYTRKSGDWREKLKTGSWKNEARLGMKMFIRGKLKLLPPACKKVKEVRNLFEKAEAHKKV